MLKAVRRAFHDAVTRSNRFVAEWLRENWDRLYGVRSYAKSALWVVPFFAMLVEQVIVRGTAALSDWLEATGRSDSMVWLFGFTLNGARSLLETIITLTLSFLVFTFGSLLVAVQVAGGQYTPRVIATIFLSNNVVRACVGLFVVTLFFAVRTLVQMGAEC